MECHGLAHLPGNIHQIFSSAPFLLGTSKPSHPFEARGLCVTLRRIIAETSWVARASSLGLRHEEPLNDCGGSGTQSILRSSYRWCDPSLDLSYPLVISHIWKMDENGTTKDDLPINTRDCPYLCCMLSYKRVFPNIILISYMIVSFPDAFLR